ncbi:cell division protein ZapE [Ahrensia sp. R2A130]|uniref:cell division protein ZapE n=1 Tax=Ahrensia sp. R2A130 TaxID=744979 RepID=UPI0002F7C8E5|nr:cell division protein ZapE [Ahrensia sp. R2A130]
MADTSRTLQQTVDGRIASGELRHDAAQANAIVVLDDLLVQLAEPRLGNKSSALGWLFGKKPTVSLDTPRGLYLWGGVGRGKSMLMDTFYELAPTQPKKRVHFHAFMQDVHARIHEWRQGQKKKQSGTGDPIVPLAVEIAEEAHLLCFDEFTVTDVADAMILARLFTGLFERGVTVVATSNVDPDLLYKDGLNRSFFLPFIDVVKDRMHVVELASDTDHRMEKLINTDVYFVDDRAGFDALWADMRGEKPEGEAEIELRGRKLSVDKAAGGVARMGFDALCRAPLGAGDYLALAERFHTLFIDGIPVMEHADRNAAKRFITLIDTLYEARRVVIVEAAARPSGLYPIAHGTEAFEFDRTISRLREMQSREWLDGAKS